jgi:hypothetical protein
MISSQEPSDIVVFFDKGSSKALPCAAVVAALTTC